MTRMRCAILDDYQNVALKMADWSPIKDDVDIKLFDNHLGGAEAVARALQGFGIVVAMRERTPFPRALIEALPDLKLLITTGARNASIDMAAAKEHGVLVCGTPSFGSPTAGIAIGLMLELTRRIGFENGRLKAGAPWQVTIGPDLQGKILGVIGLGKLGTRVSAIAKAFGMEVVAWSQNLTAERCGEAGVDYATKEDLLRQSDFVSIHLILSQRSRGLIGANELGLMKPTAYLINTSRGPIITRLRCSRRCAPTGSPGPGSMCSMLSRCRSIIRCASSIMSCSPRISAMSAPRTTAPISPAWSRISAASSTASQCG
jgi:D-3-phosphoglycerate dehydrogenase